MNGDFFIVGVGPGDPELITMKAARILRESPVVFVPKGSQDGASTALAILNGVVETKEKEVIEHHFPMKKICMGKKPDPEVIAAWKEAALQVRQKLQQGLNVVFPTLGDPAIYSTGFYLCDTLLSIMPEANITVVPGVSSIGACAAATVSPLCLGDDRLAVIPATYENGRLQNILEEFDTVVLMKVHRVMGRVVPLLEQMSLLDKAVLVEKSGQQSEQIVKNIAAVDKERLHYFSTIIVRK